MLPDPYNVPNSPIVRGAVAGAILGYFITTAVYGYVSGSNLSGLMGFAIGVPAGMTVGGIIGVILSPRRK
jgi:hypothetical protein